MANDFETEVPYDLVPGVYANADRIWHTQSEFTIDFLTKPVNEETVDLARVVSRVKIPTMMMFELIQDLNTDMTDYEAQYGEIPRLEGDA